MDEMNQKNKNGNEYEYENENENENEKCKWMFLGVQKLQNNVLTGLVSWLGSFYLICAKCFAIIEISWVKL